MLQYINRHKNVGGREHARPNYKQYILHQNEPAERERSRLDPNIEIELAKNRRLLKRRVWKSAEKYRKSIEDMA